MTLGEVKESIARKVVENSLHEARDLVYVSWLRIAAVKRLIVVVTTITKFAS